MPGPSTRYALATAADIVSIRDLAAWPPYQTARELLDRVYNPLALPGVADYGEDDGAARASC
jgi:hypothetical protein